MRLFFRLRLILIFSGFISASLFSQQIRFKVYSRDQGIMNPFVYSVSQDKNGFLYLATGEEVYRFDGFTFVPVRFQKEELKAYATRVFSDDNGNLWFGMSNGQVFVWDGKSSRRINIPSRVTSQITEIQADKTGIKWIVTQQNGIFGITENEQVIRCDSVLPGETLTSALFTGDNNLFIAADDGIYIFTLSGNSRCPVWKGKIENFPETRVNKLIQLQSSEGILAATDDYGLLKIDTEGPGGSSFRVSDFGKGFGIDQQNITSVFEDTDHNIWVSVSGEGVIEILWDQQAGRHSGVRRFNTSNGLPVNYIRSFFQDREGQIWMATYGNGVVSFTDEALQFYDFSGFTGKNITAVTVRGTDLILAGQKGVLVLNKNTLMNRFFVPAGTKGLPSDRITAMFTDRRGLVWLGTSESGCYLFDVNAVSFRRIWFSGNAVENVINHINGKGDSIFIATNGGLVIMDLVRNTSVLLTMADGLPYNIIQSVYVDRKGKVWLACASKGIFNLSDHTYRSEGISALIEFSAIAQDTSGNYWAGTLGQGVLCFLPDTLFQVNSASGLGSNYVYGAVSDRDGEIWLGHRMSISRIDPVKKSVKVFDKAYGFTADCNPNALVSDPGGVLWIGTTEGLVGYNLNMEKKTNIPPVINIVSLRIDDKEYDPAGRIVLPYGSHRVRIEFIGLNFRSPERVFYRYRMKGFDPEWTDAGGNRFVNYNNLREGKYAFGLMACNDQGDCSEKESFFTIEVRLPLWKQWWFLLTVLASTALAVYGIMYYRQKQTEEYNKRLEAELVERTREVVQKKEEIELKNKEIIQSIEYAQRIQQSMLPSATQLEQYFTGYFLFYRPRDIVSGDFYWFDKLKDNRFLLICADSTGHGVPGGFMSVMGTTLIKDICYRSDLESPSEMLALLDHEIHRRLNQNIEAERSNDGMDLILCDINLDTYVVRIASAMRPVILYINGEQMYIPGSRNSVGGTIISSDDKVFEDRVYAMSKGDLIYMFSDGFTDQFGGPLGKKFKIARLRNLLKDIHQKPMTEQYQHIKSTFDLWKGDQPQIDDVLFLGIQL